MSFWRGLLAVVLFLAVIFTMCSCDAPLTKEQVDLFKDPPGAISGAIYLGCGYDIFGHYAKTSSLKQRVLELGAYSGSINYDGKDYTAPEQIELLPILEAEVNSSFGETLTKFMEDYKAHTKVSVSGALWQASLKADFNYNHNELKQYFYHRLSQVYDQYRLRLTNVEESQLKAMVNPQFKTDLETMDPAKLFDKYGTHYLAEVVMGARCDYNARTEKTEETLKIKTKIEACGKKKFGSIGAKCDASVDTDHEMETYENHTTVQIRAQGGHLQKIDAIRTANDYSSWLDSINAGNYSMCSFTQDSLRPIWELCADKGRREVLAAAFDVYAAGKQLPLPTDETGELCLLHLTTAKGSTAAVSVPQGFTKINVDLNSGAGGKYIYLCYQKGRAGSTDPLPITDLVLRHDKGAQGDGWEKIPQDLNEGAGGDYIYLWYKRDPSKSPIHAVNVKSGKNTPSTPGYTYVTWNDSSESADVNRGARGDYIWIEYTTN